MKKGWETQSLGDVLDVIRNGVNCKQDKKGIGQKITRIETISQAEFDFDKVGYSKLSETEKDKFRLEKGDILFSHINSVIHVGKTAYYDSDEEIYHGVNLLLMRPKEFLSSRYLEYFLKSLFLAGYWRKICKQSVNQASVNQQDVSKVLINYPTSLPEQQRIVSLLDETFAALTKVHANAERNLVNAREVFESAQREIFVNGKNKNTEIKTLGDIASFRNGINFTKGSKGETLKIVGVKDFQNNFWVPSENLDSVRIDGKLNETDYLQKGDILAVRSNGNQQLIGRTILASDVTEKTTHSGFTIRIRFEAKDIFPEYLCHYLKSDKARKQMISGGAGISIKSLNQQTLSNLPIPLPPLEEQRAIVERLDALAGETRRLEAVYQSKLEAVEELRKSVLGKAFEGEL